MQLVHVVTFSLTFKIYLNFDIDLIKFVDLVSQKKKRQIKIHRVLNPFAQFCFPHHNKQKLWLNSPTFNWKLWSLQDSLF